MMLDGAPTIDAETSDHAVLFDIVLNDSEHVEIVFDVHGAVLFLHYSEGMDDAAFVLRLDVAEA
jgi:hypothetical protein